MIKTRFAPSPTGTLHVGSVRTALYAWLFARHNKGSFLLRIEDTDQERSTKESAKAIIDGLAWLGIDCDEGPIFQTDRYARYQELANRLLEESKAYRCTCSKERLEALREKQLATKEKPRYDGHCRDKAIEAGIKDSVIRFKNPDFGTVHFHDQVYGNIQVESSELDDLILIRSDGHPTYNFAVVIDDWDMKITHVIRGDDHINNTPRQINLFKAFNAPIPIFAHLPMILGDDGKRLSKRHGAVNVLQFREQGILPEALLNYLVRLGWSHGDQEIFSKNEMIEHFDLAQVSRGVASFNYDKLYWLNQHYLKSLDPKDIAAILPQYFAGLNIDISKGPSLEKIVSLQADRCNNLVDMAAISKYFYEDTLNYDEKAIAQHWNPKTLEPLIKLRADLAALEDWSIANLEACVKNLCTEFAIGLGKIGQPLRIALTGGTSSPSLYATLDLIGKERVLERLDFAIKQKIALS